MVSENGGRRSDEQKVDRLSGNEAQLMSRAELAAQFCASTTVAALRARSQVLSRQPAQAQVPIDIDQPCDSNGDQ